jgi:hypothetical protein
VTLVRENYIDFGPTFAAEKLAEDHDLKISRETLRECPLMHPADALPDNRCRTPGFGFCANSAARFINPVCGPCNWNKHSATAKGLTQDRTRSRVHRIKNFLHHGRQPHKYDVFGDSAVGG